MRRRDFLLGVAAAPVLLTPQRISAVPEIHAESHCMSQESARGFQLLFDASPTVPRSLIVLPACRALSAETCSRLVQKAAAGAWILYESGLCFSSGEESSSQLDLLREGFGLNALAPVPANGAYIAYNWPTRQLVRSFHGVTPLRCLQRETIAAFNGVPVCAKRPLGKGGIAYLGSQIGPGLAAEEREAQSVVQGICRLLYI